MLHGALLRSTGGHGGRTGGRRLFVGVLDFLRGKHGHPGGLFVDRRGRASIAELGDVQVVENGTLALEDAVASVQSDLQEVADDGTSQYSAQVDGLRADFDQLQAAAGSALDMPSTASVTAVTSAASALADDVSRFEDDLATTC
jgi:hypothetical protein